MRGRSVSTWSVVVVLLALAALLVVIGLAALRRARQDSAR
jgi:uncharacterized membrane protein